MSSFINCIIHEYNKTDAPKISTAKDVYEQMTDIKDASKEIFVAFHLNTKNQVIAREILAIGILDAGLIHPREVFRSAIINNVNSIILAHNHPSGDTEPSTEDKEITKNLKQAGELLDIKILDHVVVGTNGYTSLKEVE